MKRFTDQEKAWLKEHYPADESREETYKKFVEVFGINHTLISMVCYCKDHHINKPIHRIKYQKGNKTWSTGLSGEEYRSHFTKESYNNMIDTKKRNFPHIVAIEKWEKENGPIPEGYVLSDLGNGEMMLMRKDIYKCLTWHKALHQGEYTKAMYENYLLKREIEKVCGKRIMRNLPQCERRN